MTKRFSKEFNTFREWQMQASKGGYSKRITRLHDQYPKASLSQLRGHAKQSEKPITQTKELEIHKRSWDSLSPSELDQRKRGLDVLSLMRRRGYSLSQASEEVGISPSLVIKNTNALKKVDGRWIAKTSDRISRVVMICEDGREFPIETKDSRYASTIGRYHSTIGEFFHTGDASVLEAFEGKRVRDANGNWHVLETDPTRLHEIREARVEEEFYTIYKGAW